MAEIEEPEFEADVTSDGDVPDEKGYKKYLEDVANETWLKISKRTQRIMHGMCQLELMLGKIPLGDLNIRIRWSEFLRLVAMSILVLKKEKHSRWRLVYEAMMNDTEEEVTMNRKTKIIRLSILIVRKGLMVDRKVAFHSTIYKYRQWRRIVYSTMRKYLEQLSLGLEKVNNVATIKVKRLEHEESWKRYTCQYPWARAVPLIISLARWSCIEYQAEELDQSRIELVGQFDDIESDNAEWVKCGTTIKTRGMCTSEEIQIWWNELNTDSRIHYLVHTMYARVDYSREWHHQNDVRLKWYLGHTGVAEDGLQSGRTLFHSRKCRTKSGGSVIPKVVRVCKYVEEAKEAALTYCDKLAHLPLGKGPGCQASLYTSGRQIVRNNESVNKPWQMSSIRTEVNVHPKDIWHLAIHGDHYHKIIIRPNFELMDGKDRHWDTLANMGINTAIFNVAN